MHSLSKTQTMSALNVEQLFGVKGYVAAVTGGSSGLGFMICKVSLWRYELLSSQLKLLT